MTNENTTKTQPWLRQPRETAKTYTWFTYYRDQGPERTHKKTIQAIKKHNEKVKQQELKENNSEEIKKIPVPALRNLQNLASIHKWTRRAIAYDNWREEQRALAKEAMYLEEEQKYVETMKNLRDSIANTIYELELDERAKSTSKAHALKSISQAMDTTLKDLRLITGKSTENSATNVTAEVDQTHTVDVDGKVKVDVHQTLTDSNFHSKELEFMKELIKKDD